MIGDLADGLGEEVRVTVKVKCLLLSFKQIWTQSLFMDIQEGSSKTFLKWKSATLHMSNKV